MLLIEHVTIIYWLLPAGWPSFHIRPSRYFHIKHVSIGVCTLTKSQMFISLSELKIDFGLFTEIPSHMIHDERPKNKKKLYQFDKYRRRH